MKADDLLLLISGTIGTVAVSLGGLKRASCA
jgi:hypothetical protein